MNLPIKPLDMSDSANDIAKDLSSKLTKNIGSTLADCWFLVFGGISHKADIRRLQYAHDLEEYKNELVQNMEAIPSKKVVEPDFQTVTQALDASKYCISNEQLRHMFASLVANTMNSDYSNYVSPAFPNILRQMSSYDATLFALIRNFDVRPLVKYIVHNESGYKAVLEHITLVQEPFMDFELQSLSLSSLNLLGLLDFSYSQRVSGPTDLYFDFINNFYFQKLKEEYRDTSYTPDIQRGSCALTPLGKSFAKVCLDPGKFPPLFA